MSKGSYSVKYVADFIKSYGMRSLIIRVGRNAAILYGCAPSSPCPLYSIESKVCSYSYVLRLSAKL